MDAQVKKLIAMNHISFLNVLSKFAPKNTITILGIGATIMDPVSSPMKLKHIFAINYARTDQGLDESATVFILTKSSLPGFGTSFYIRGVFVPCIEGRAAWKVGVGLHNFKWLMDKNLLKKQL